MTLPGQIPIPRAVREYGKILDPKLCEPGDLLLFKSLKPTWATRKIIAAQRQMFSDDHALWSHVAVSGGRFEICEADIGGVVAREFWDYMTGDFDIRIRRLKNATPQERALVAYYSATAVRTRYGFANLIGLARSLSDGAPWTKAFRFTNGMVCSQLYFEACMRVGILLAKVPPDHVCPSHLSQSDQLEEVSVAWVSL